MSLSRPATPPSKAPSKGSDRRFKPLITPCEWVESYHPGGYHPVHIGDTFHDGQYRIVRKLGEGSFSTVWLARDLLNQKYVALKIVTASASQTNELRFLRFLMQESSHAATRYITRLLQTFEHTGPNGVHKCLVFEPMGPSVNFMVEEIPQTKPRTVDTDDRYPPEMGRSILKQSLQALAFLHENGIAHGDFQPGNMLFSLDDIDSVPEDQLRQTEETWKEYTVGRDSMSPVERLDGKTDLWAPRYLCSAHPLSAFTKHTAGFKIKLSDLGSAYFFDDLPIEDATPRGLQAPETILTHTMNNTLDVWSFGCLVFELMTGQQLFNVCSFGSKLDDQDQHLLELNGCLGALPEDIMKQWERSALYFTPEGKLYNCRLGGMKDKPYMFEQQSLEKRFDAAAPDLDEKEATAVKALIRRILQYDPAKRPTPSELLQDPWFRDIDDAGNLTS